jgi:hypothetical protein
MSKDDTDGRLVTPVAPMKHVNFLIAPEHYAFLLGTAAADGGTVSDALRVLCADSIGRYRKAHPTAYVNRIETGESIAAEREATRRSREENRG